MNSNLITPHSSVAENESLMRWFLEHDANPNARAEGRDITPLSLAVMHGSFGTIKLVFQYGGSAVYGQLLKMASGRTDLDSVPILQFLFDHGDARVNNTYMGDLPEQYQGLDDAAPLHHAARVGNIDTVRWLLKHGANPTVRNRRVIRYGTTPLDSALFFKHEEIAELLLQAEATLPDELHHRPWLADQHGTDFKSKTNREIFASEPTIVLRQDINHGNSGPMVAPNHVLQNYSMYLMLCERDRKEKGKAERETKQLSDSALERSGQRDEGKVRPHL